MKKLLSIALVVVLLAGIAVSGTMAYLTSEDSDVNVMTLGNVKIEQIEEQRVDTKTAGTLTEEDIEDFEQGKPLLPYVDVNMNKAMGDDYEEVTFPNGQTNKLFIGDNAIDKLIAVKNTGASDAYVRSIIALEAPTEKIDLSFNSTDWTMDKDASSISVDINGTKYDLFVVIYKHTLKPGETTPYSLMQFSIDWSATNEDLAAYGDTYDIPVLSQAVQTAGFADAKTALDAGFGEVTKENVEKWFASIGNVKYVEADNQKAQIEGEAAQEILDTLESGKNLIVDKKVDIIAFDDTEVDGKDATVTMAGTGSDAYGYLAFVPAAGEDATVENLTVTGSGFVEVGHYGQGGGDYVVNNLVIKNLKATVPVTDGANRVSPAFCHYGNAELNNCTMTGATTVDSTATAYDAGFVNGTNTTINGGEYGSMYLWSQAHVTIKGAKVGTISSAAITNKNLGMLTIGAGAVVDTINLIPAGTYTPALTIEEGATVGKIIYKGVTYTQAEWLAITGI